MRVFLLSASRRRRFPLTLPSSFCLQSSFSSSPLISRLHDIIIFSFQSPNTPLRFHYAEIDILLGFGRQYRYFAFFECLFYHSDSLEKATAMARPSPIERFFTLLFHYRHAVFPPALYVTRHKPRPLQPRLTSASVISVSFTSVPSR